MLLLVLPLRLSQSQEKPVPCFHVCKRVKPLPGLDSLPARVTQIEQPVRAYRYNSALQAEVQSQDEWKDCGHKLLWKHGRTTTMEKASLEKARNIY